MYKRNIFRSLKVSILLIMALLVPITSVFASGGDQLVTYEVTLENLTDGQIFSPPIFITHQRGYKLFHLGRFASEELRLIAEEGNNGPAAEDANASLWVFDVEALSTPLLPGESLTITIQVPRKSRISLAGMLVQTNDGFVGANSLRLPWKGSWNYNLRVYDAGTEKNNELAAYVPGPPFGGTMRDPSNQSIRPHKGIQGIGDIDPEIYDWDEPAAKLTVTVIDY